MTYYAKFDNGSEKDSEVNLFIETPQESGWYLIGDNYDGGFYKLVNNSAVKMSESEKNAYLDSITFNSKMRELREKREVKLRLSDWTQGPDSPLSAEKKTEWANYRQSLRDLTTNITNRAQAESYIFPEEPA